MTSNIRSAPLSSPTMPWCAVQSSLLSLYTTTVVDAQLKPSWPIFLLIPISAISAWVAYNRYLSHDRTSYARACGVFAPLCFLLCERLVTYVYGTLDSAYLTPHRVVGKVATDGLSDLIHWFQVATWVGIFFGEIFGFLLHRLHVEYDNIDTQSSSSSHPLLLTQEESIQYPSTFLRARVPSEKNRFCETV